MQSASTSARLSEKIKRRPGGYLFSASRAAYRMPRASRILMFSSRTKPPFSVNFLSEGSRSRSDTSEKSARRSLRASDTSQPNLNTLKNTPKRFGLEYMCVWQPFLRLIKYAFPSGCFLNIELNIFEQVAVLWSVSSSSG